ncbi:unnamed protein product [Closterium sp. NIES-54]
MYALSVSAEGDCYLCVPPDQGIAADALGASESGTLSGPAPAEALHTFTLDSRASRCFFRDSTTLTPLPAPVLVRLADPSGGPVVACSSTVLPCPAVSASGQVAASCSCCLLSHQTLLWYHRLGHPSMPRLRGMHSRLLVSGLPRSLPPLPPSPAPPCLPCVEGRQRAAPHSSFLPTTAPLQTLHMDAKGQRDFCRGEGILHSFTLLDSPQQNGIAESRIGLVMEVARISMIHAAAPHFLWPFAVWYAGDQLNLWPRVSLPETSPTLRWTGEVGDASVFQDVTFDESVPFYRLFPYRSAPPPAPPLFLAPGPPPVDTLSPQGPAPSGVAQVEPRLGPAPVQVAVDSGAAQGAASGGAEPGGAEFEGAETGGAEPGGVETGGVEPRGVATGGGELGGAESEGVEPGGGASKGAESGGVDPQGASSSGGFASASPRLSPQQLREWFVQCPRLRSGAAGAGGAGGAGAARAGGTRVVAGAGVTGGTATTGPGGARTWGTGAAGSSGVEGAGAGGLTESGTTSAGGAGAGGARVDGPGAGGAGVGGPGFLGTPPSAALTPPLLCPLADQLQQPLQPASPLPAPSPYTEQSGGLTERREPASCPLSPVRIARRVPPSRPPPVPGTHAMTLRPSSVPLRCPLLAPPESSLPAVPDPESDRARAASPTVSRLLATAVTNPSFESAAAYALVVELLEFSSACRLNYATALVSESASTSPPSIRGECALGTDVLEDRQEDFECLAVAVPRFASMLLAPEGDPDAPDIPTPRSYAEAITGTYVDEVPPPGANIVDGMWIFKVKRPPGSPPAFKARYVARGFSQRQGVDYFHTFSPTPQMTTLWVLLHVAAQRDYELHSLDFSTAFLQGNQHEEIWLRRPPGFTESFLAGTQWSICWPVYGLRKAPREWHDTLRTTLAALGFAPATADPSQFLRTDTSLPPSMSLSASTTSYLGLQITRDRARRTITLTQSHMVHQVLQRPSFQFSSPEPTPLSTSHSLSAPPSDESVEPSGSYPELVGCLMYQMTCTRPDLAYPLSLLAGYVALGRHRKVHWDAAKRVLRYLCSTSGMGLVLGGRGPVVLTGHADASWELRWLTYLLTDLGEQPRSPPALYVDNKAMIALW